MFQNIPPNQRVYTVEAHIGDFSEQYEREIKYTIEVSCEIFKELLHIVIKGVSQPQYQDLVLWLS